jgi:uncharacterized membrane protein
MQLLVTVLLILIAFCMPLVIRYSWLFYEFEIDLFRASSVCVLLMTVAGYHGIINELALRGCAAKAKGTDVDESMLAQRLPLHHVSEFMINTYVIQVCTK